MSVASIQTNSVAGIPTTDLAVARRIMRALLPAETGIDSAIVAQTDLIGSIVRGRMEMGAPIELGHDAAVLAAHSLAHLFEAREDTIKCHQRLAVTRDVLGLDGSDVGCSMGKVSARKARAA
jgi:hypothetical protein